MPRVTQAQLEELGDRGLQPGHGPAAACRLEELASVAGALRTEALVRAAEVWDRSGDYVRAEDAYRAAAAEGGSCWIDARTALGAFLLDRGRREEAVELLEAARADHPEDPVVYEVTGEAFEAAGELQEALRWFNVGYTRLEPTGKGSHLRTGRWRVRRALGLPVDDLDQQDAADRQALRASTERAARWAADGGPMIQPFVPAEHWARWKERWPEAELVSAPSYAESATELQGLLDEERVHGRLVCVGLDLDGLLEYAEAEDCDPARWETQEDYAQALVQQGRGVAWPPGRNEPCWCGSGTKYKRCCARFR